MQKGYISPQGHKKILLPNLNQTGKFNFRTKSPSGLLTRKELERSVGYNPGVREASETLKNLRISLERTKRPNINFSKQSLKSRVRLPNMRDDQRSIDMSHKSPVSQMLQKWDKPKTKKYKCFIGPGNTDAVIRVLEDRGCWQFAESMGEPKLDLIWKQTISGINFNDYNELKAFQSPLFNHFEFHSEISQKDSLLRNMAKYCENNGLYVFDYLPPSFEVRTDFKNLTASKEGIAALFDILTSGIPREIDIDISQQIRDLAQRGEIKSSEVIRKLDALFANTSRVTLIPATMNKGQNLWMIKPIDFNRGNGIEMLSSALELPRILKSLDGQIKSAHSKARGRLLMQKYIESPLLIDKRKFDIRMWVLIDSHLNLYIFPEGYIRLSSEEFSLYDNGKLIHLTNNAVQMHGMNYGKFEQGNQMSFSDFRRLLRTDKDYAHLDWNSKIYPTMYKQIKASFNSAINKINSNRRQRNFELFGIDFMLDAEGGVWLIEVNTNPCLELSSPHLEILIPRMLDDAFSLTVDRIFPFNTENRRRYPVSNYSDSNMWVMIN